MSFRARLTTFFVLIVIVPMVGVGLLVFSLINASEAGKADARVSGIAVAADSLYRSEAATARAQAAALAHDAGLLRGTSLAPRLAVLAARSGLARVMVRRGPRVLVDIGDRNAIAPGSARAISGSAPPTTITTSGVSATDFVHELTRPPDEGLVVRQGGQTLASTVPGAPAAALPLRGTVHAGKASYRVITQALPGFGPRPLTLTVFSNLDATAGTVDGARAIAIGFIVGFVLLALAFAVLASRALDGQLARFLEAARRLGAGDFSAPVPIEGDDEFAALGTEFNRMSAELEQRLGELSRERVRLRGAIERIGQTFAANLDRAQLLKLALQTAVDGVEAQAGRLSFRAAPDAKLVESARAGGLSGFESLVLEAERAALRSGDPGQEHHGDAHALSVVLGGRAPDSPAQGLITVCRRGEAFGDEDRELLRSFSTQASSALDNVDLHLQVQRRALTDELTGLANRGRFQDRLGMEIEHVRRYHHPVGLIMLDLDDFKQINDTYGHPQGDAVLRRVADVLRGLSRDADTPARYGGEEMALILPHTDLEGAYAIAERLRAAVEALRIPRLDGHGQMRVTASLCVSATLDGDRDELVADADAALYMAKRHGKNRTLCGGARIADGVPGE